MAVNGLHVGSNAQPSRMRLPDEPILHWGTNTSLACRRSKRVSSCLAVTAPPLSAPPTSRRHLIEAERPHDLHRTPFHHHHGPIAIEIDRRGRGRFNRLRRR